VSGPGSLFGYRVKSELPLDRLRRGDAPRGTIEIRRATAPLDGDGGTEIGRLDHPDGSPLFTITERDDGFTAWCATSGTFRAEPETGLIVTDAGEPSPFWQDRTVNAIVPLLLSARGELMLHAAALGGDGRAVLLCGVSGRGKSTLAHALARLGADVVAEDSVAVTVDGERALAWPGPVGVRLRPTNGARAKSLHLPETGGRDPQPVEVGAIALLEPRGGTQAEVRRLTTAEALAPAFPHAIQGRPARRQETFSQVAALLRRVPAYSARVPDDLERLDEAAAAVWARLRA
jgi:hypothetical protein